VEPCSTGFYSASAVMREHMSTWGEQAGMSSHQSQRRGRPSSNARIQKASWYTPVKTLGCRSKPGLAPSPRIRSTAASREIRRTRQMSVGNHFLCGATSIDNPPKQGRDCQAYGRVTL
jgi:hypothetical protein